jgi:flagellar basal-body rod protein FlgC
LPASATTPDGVAYRRKEVLVSTIPPGNTFQDVLNSRREGLSGVKIVRIIEDQSPLKRVYEPSNPAADEEGHVECPNVDVLKEMVNMMGASRSYEADITVFNASRTMALQALEIGS